MDLNFDQIKNSVHNPKSKFTVSFSISQVYYFQPCFWPTLKLDLKIIYKKNYKKYQGREQFKMESFYSNAYQTEPKISFFLIEQSFGTHLDCNVDQSKPCSKFKKIDSAYYRTRKIIFFLNRVSTIRP